MFQCLKGMNVWCIARVAFIITRGGDVLRTSDAFILVDQHSPLRRINTNININSNTKSNPMIQTADTNAESVQVQKRRNRIIDDTKFPFRESNSQLWANNEKSVEEVAEEARLTVLTDRRKTIRGTLRTAEALQNFRVANNFVPEIDPETGKPMKSDSKVALTFTAFIVAAGAVTLRIGGRAALVSAIGLDFANENPELKESMDTFLSYASALPPATEGLLFLAAWTVVKVFCFDFGGVILALSSGILFGGVLQGAFCSALAATIGSTAAFLLAKAETPVRKKALEIVEEYPSLRGIEKVVAEDGLKAILTLRLAPVLPIPIGMYNYVYGVTNVPYFDFAGGVFLGSLKPYLLDSYLGVFGKQVVEGTAGDSGGIQDIILLVVLGVSVLIGVFASQLAGETWDSVTQEIEEEQRLQNLDQGEEQEVDDGIAREIMGIGMPEWVIGMQLSLQAASVRVENMIQVEYTAAAWNYTLEEPPPVDMNPAKFPDSPEQMMVGTGFDIGTSICEGLVLSPCLLQSFLKYADPLYVPNTIEIIAVKESGPETTIPELDQNVVLSETSQKLPAPKVETNESEVVTSTGSFSGGGITVEEEEKMLLNILSTLRDTTQNKLQQVDEEMKSL